jgi:hypothetical protein
MLSSYYNYDKSNKKLHQKKYISIYSKKEDQYIFMKIPNHVEGQGVVEYFLLLIIAILFILIIVKLFGPATNNFIQSFLETV